MIRYLKSCLKTEVLVEQACQNLNQAYKSICLVQNAFVVSFLSQKQTLANCQTFSKNCIFLLFCYLCVCQAFNFHGSLYSKISIDFLKVRYHIFCYFQPKMLCQYKSEKIWSLIAPNVYILERTERSQDVQVCASFRLSYGRFYSLYLSTSNYLLTSWIKIRERNVSFP